MKRYATLIMTALIALSACNKESPVEQKEKTEAAISEVVNSGVSLQGSEALQALESMPSNSPIESSFPVGSEDEWLLTNVVLKKIPFLKRNIQKSPLDSISGTWEYDEGRGEWIRTSDEPSDGVVLIWNFQDTTGAVREARFNFIRPQWYNDTLLTNFEGELYIDSVKVAFGSYELTVQNGVAAKVSLNATIVGEAEFSLEIEAANGHSLDEDNFYGTISLSLSDLETGSSFTLDITINEDGSTSLKLVMSENNETWEFYVAISSPDPITGYSNVSGYIKNGDDETARIEGTLRNGEISEIFIVYDDGTRVSVTEYLTFVGPNGS